MTSADMNVSARPSEIIRPFDYKMVPFAKELREAAEKIRKRTAACVIDNGRDLSEWRDQLKPGQFRRWVESEFGFSVRTAELAIMVAKYVDANDKHEIISHLRPTLQYLIAAPTTPQPVRESVLNSYADGQRLKVKHVKEMLRTAKRATSQPVLTTGDQSDELTPDDEQRERAQAAKAEATKHQPVTLPEEGLGGELAEDRPVTEAAETASVAESASAGYVEKIIDILGREVTSKGLLIALLDRAGYDGLARGLQAYEDQRVRDAA